MAVDRTPEGKPEWISVAEAARLVSVTAPALSYYIRQGRLPTRKGKRGTRNALLVPKDKVLELFANSPRRPGLAKMYRYAPTLGDSESAALRAELAAVRAHLADVRALLAEEHAHVVEGEKARDRLLTLLGQRMGAN